MKVRNYIPNTITSLNLFSGCVGITFALTGNLESASICIGLAAVFDFLDGFFARLLHVKSEIGKQLDSLADVISFGLLPGVIIFTLMRLSTNLPEFQTLPSQLFAYSAFMIPVFSALRLAKFNIDDRQTESFLGMPTPSSALIIGALPLIIYQNSNNFLSSCLIGLSTNFYFLLALVLVISALLVSELPLFSLKIKELSWKKYKPQLLLLLISILLLIWIQITAIPLVIAIYVILSLIFRDSFKPVK